MTTAPGTSTRTVPRCASRTAYTERPTGGLGTAQAVAVRGQVGRRTSSARSRSTAHGEHVRRLAGRGPGFAPLAWAFALRAGDENRTRTISLGIRPIHAAKAADQPGRATGSSRD